MINSKIKTIFNEQNSPEEEQIKSSPEFEQAESFNYCKE